MLAARTMVVAVLMTIGFAIAVASVAGDPKVYAGAECCACLQATSPTGEDLESAPVGERSARNCLPGDNAADETCTNEVASQVDSSGGGDPVRVLDSACYETHCQAECASALENGIAFTISDGG